MKVDELPTYQKTFDYMPPKAVLAQVKVIFSELIKKFGIFGTIGFLRQVIKKQKQLKEKYGDDVNKRFADVPAIEELYVMGAMYLVIAESEGQEKAYNEFIKGIMQKIGPISHESLYSFQALKKVDGDIFTNFRKLNRALFENGAKKNLYGVEEIRDSQNLQYIRVTKCLNIEATSAIECPALAKMGCDIDIAGYAPNALGNKVDLDFRRPRTLANGDEACEFYYYRAGYAPEDMNTI